jgi:hypothetical protein
MEKKIKSENIVFIQYNGVDRPFQVYTDKLVGFDFFYNKGLIQCNWCSLNLIPFLNELSPIWKGKKKLKIWFKEDFRPTDNSLKNKKILSNKEIENMGYIIIQEPKYLDEIIEAINKCPYY